MSRAAVRLLLGRALPPVLRDPREAPAAQLLEGDAGRQRFFLAERAAARAAQEEVEQPLAGRRVVEGVAGERRLPEPGDEVAQPLARAGEAFEEEGVERAVAAGKLRRVQVPSL